MGKLKKESKTNENSKKKEADKIDGSIKKSKKNKDKLKKKLKEAPAAIVQENLNVDSNGKEKSTTKKDKAIKKSLGKKIEKKQLKKSKNNVENKNSPTKTEEPTCESKAKPSHAPATEKENKVKKAEKKHKQREKAAKLEKHSKLSIKSSGQARNTTLEEELSQEGFAKKKTKQKKKNKVLKTLKVQKKNDASPKIKKLIDADPKMVLFIGNLPPKTQSKHLRTLLKEFSPITSIRLRTASGKEIYLYKNCKEKITSLNAYVVFQNAETAEKALSLNGIEFKGQKLRVTRSDVCYGGNNEKKNTIFVGNLSYAANDQKLHEIFSNCGEIDYVRCLQIENKGCNGVAFVCFKSPDALPLAMELNGTMLDNRPIHLEYYSEKKLGAMEARKRNEPDENKTKKKPLHSKVRYWDAKNKASKKSNSNGNANVNANKTKKKNEYRGVKVPGIKKSKAKKKMPNKMMILAKKIAPK